VAGLPEKRMQHFILGSDASEVARAEAIAGTTEVVITASTYKVLGACRVQEKEGLFRVISVRRDTSPARVFTSPALTADCPNVLAYLPPPIARALEAPGQAAQTAGEHRKTTTIFIHLMGVDDLIAREGPLIALSELDKYVSTVVRLADKYGGFLAGSDIYTEGVKLILAFGTPVTREDDAANALRLALEPRLSFDGSPSSHRIGINTGRVRWRRGSSLPPRIHSHRVRRLSARLMSAAQTGQILASPAPSKADRLHFA
jgi:class 3 adenylate cyclase